MKHTGKRGDGRAITECDAINKTTIYYVDTCQVYDFRDLIMHQSLRAFGVSIEPHGQHARWGRRSQ